METFVDTDGLPAILCTGVGSLPHVDSAAATQMVLSSLRRAPHAAQLPRVDPREQMWIQFTENVPRFVVDVENLSYFFDTSGSPETDVERFYSEYLKIAEGGDPEAFSVSPEYGRGIWELFETLRDQSMRFPVLKVQVTGPLSFALTVTDEARKPIFYHPLFRDVAVKAMGLKAVWLVELFRPFADRIIVFFDEPGLTAYGSSAFLGVSRNDVLESLNDVISMVAERGAIPGVHCCGNTDWGLIMETEASIVNFDAVDYMESLSIYSREVAAFLERGGVLAWGAVRNTDEVREESASDVIRRIREGSTLLERAGIDRCALSRHIVITPACGCAGMTVQDAERVYQLMSELDSLDPAGIFSS